MKKIFCKQNNVKYIILTLLSMVYFGYMITNLNYMLYFATGLTIIFFSKLKISISQVNLSWILCLIISWVSLIYTLDVKRTLEFSLMLTCLVIIKIIFEHLTNWQLYFINVLWSFSFIHVIATLFQYIFPNLFYLMITQFNIISINTSKEFYQLGNYAGITEQTGVNAFFISTFICVTFTKILTSKKIMKLHYFLWIISLFSLVLTGKRGPLITVGIVMLIIFSFHFYYNKSKQFKNILLILIISIIGLFIIDKIPEVNNIILKFKILSKSNDVSNGRYDLWINTLDYFNNHSFMGSGMAAIPKVINEMSHNIYIQLLGEVGILGCIVFIFTFLISLVKTLKIFIIQEKKNGIYLSNIMISIFLQIYFLIYGFTGNPLYGHMFITIYILSISLGTVNNRRFKV